jgi:hypothetical protein
METSKDLRARRDDARPLLSADPIRRFVPTPFCFNVPIMGRTIRVETNSSRVSSHIARLTSGYPGSQSDHSEFLWRIVVETGGQADQLWPGRSAFSDEGLRFVQFGERSFLAVDLGARQAIAVLSERLVDNDLGFTSPFLDNLFCLTSNALGLVAFWANCVSLEGKGILLFGGANNGKTSAAYVAQDLGLEFYADEGVFLDFDSGALRSWGGFWPPTFRPETLQFLPELREQVRLCAHRDFIVYHLSQPKLQHRRRLPVQPHCSLFLERNASTVPVISRISGEELARRLAGSVLFKEDDRFLEQQKVVLQCLEEVPAYVLRYASDPAFAAAKARELLAES